MKRTPQAAYLFRRSMYKYEDVVFLLQICIFEVPHRIAGGTFKYLPERSVKLNAGTLL